MLAIVAAISVASGAALADVEVSVDKGTCTQAFEILPVEHQSPTPARDITQQVNFDQTSLPPVNFTDLLSAAGLGQPAATNCYPPYPPADTQTPPSQTVRQLPGSPGGATLFLMGVGCIGAVKLGKSARGLHLHSLPDWYHTGGPLQIGGAAAFDFDYYTPVSCTLDEPVGVQQFSHHPRRDIPSRLDRQFFLSVEAPRGPPASHS